MCGPIISKVRGIWHSIWHGIWCGICLPGMGGLAGSFAALRLLGRAPGGAAGSAPAPSSVPPARLLEQPAARRPYLLPKTPCLILRHTRLCPPSGGGPSTSGNERELRSAHTAFSAHCRSTRPAAAPAARAARRRTWATTTSSEPPPAPAPAPGPARLAPGWPSRLERRSTRSALPGLLLSGGRGGGSSSGGPSSSNGSGGSELPASLGLPSFSQRPRS